MFAGQVKNDMHKIVVIDNSGFTRARLVGLLQANGYTDTEDYGFADDIARRPQRYLAGADLLIADIQLPGVTGIELALRLKRDSRYADIPIFFVSGAGDPKTISAAIKAGAADYLVKPFDNAVFLEKVKKILAGQPEIPDVFRCDEEKLADLLSLEYQRATRGGQFVTVLRLDLRKTDLPRSLTLVRSTVRRIDTVVVFRGTAVLILPLTDDNGVAVVTGKLEKLLAEDGVTLQGCDSFTYRGDGELNSDDYNQTILALAQYASVPEQDGRYL